AAGLARMPRSDVGCARVVRSRGRGAADRSDGAGRDGSGGELAARTDYPPDHPVENPSTAMTTVRDRDEAPEALRVEVTRDRRGARVTVRGELDIAGGRPADAKPT